MKMKLADEISQMLEAKLGQWQSTGFLPSASNLAKTFGVSPATMLAALHILESKKLVVMHPKRRAEIYRPNRITHLSAPLPSSRDRVVATIRKRIESGTHKCGDQIAKLDQLCASLSVSRPTVCAALRILHSDGLIHRAGKRWIVGRDDAPDNARRGSFGPFILVIQPRHHHWISLNTYRTKSFVETFTSEAARQKIRLASCTIIDGEPTLEWKGISGRAVFEFLSDPLSGYLGACVVGAPHYYQNLGSLIESLLSLKKPVTWFDSRDEMVFTGFESELYARCTFAEENAVQVAFDHLIETGHQRIGFVTSAKIASWERDRLIMLKQRAHASGNCRIVHYPFPFMSSVEEIGALLKLRTGTEYPTQRRISKVVNFLAQAIRNTTHFVENVSLDESLAMFITKWPALEKEMPSSLNDLVHTVRYLIEPSISAIIGSNAATFRPFYAAMHRCGIIAPDDISLLTFDNHLGFMDLPVDELDFGAGDLGYRAFHFISKLVPVKRSRSGDIIARPFVVDNGSVGRVES